MTVTVVLRDGGQIEAERVQRDGKAVRALIVEHHTRVDEETRTAFREPVGLTWRTWPDRQVRAIRTGGRR